jgi:photosystem II stability/assembly factor-like uncharacterized protein
LTLARTAFSLLLVAALLVSGIGVGADQDAATDTHRWSLADAPRAGRVETVGGAGGVLFAVPSDGSLLRSTDGGHTWEPVSDIPAFFKPRFAFDPREPDRAYLAAEGGLWRSVDAGRTWSKVLEASRAARIDVMESGAVVVAATFAAGTNALLRSLDEGATWTDLGAPIPAGEPLCGVAFGADESEVMAMTDRETWFTKDGGATWTQRTGAGLDYVIEPAGTVWRLNMHVLQRTTDGGATWLDVAVPAIGTRGAPHPGGGIYLGTSEGLLVTRNGGASWTNLGYGDQVFDATAIHADASALHAAFVADTRVGLARIARGPDGFVRYEGRALPLAPAPLSDVVRSETGTLAAVGPAGLFLRPAGAAWRHSGAGLGAVAAVHVGIGADASRIYVAGRDITGTPALEVSADGGETFFMSTIPAAGDVGRLLVHPSDDKRAAVIVAGAQGGSVYETTDGGVEWSEALYLPFVAVHDLAWYRPLDALLVATDLGALGRLDGTWTPLGTEPVSLIASRNDVVAAVGDRAHWQDWFIEDMPIMAPIERNAPVGAIAIGLSPLGLWLLYDSQAWWCLFSGSFCMAGRGPPSLPIAFATGGGGTLYAATADGLYANLH